MGWASGSAIARDLAEAMRKHVTVDARAKVYVAMVASLNDMDWDTHDEAEGIDPVLDVVLLADKLKWLDNDYPDEVAEVKEALRKANAEVQRLKEKEAE